MLWNVGCSSQTNCVVDLCGKLLQCVKKVVLDSPGLVYFISDYWILFLTCLMGKWSFLRNSNYKRTVKSILLIKKFLGLVEVTFGLVYASLSLPEWQAVKMTFFALCAVIFFSWSLTPPEIFLIDKYVVVHPLSFDKGVKFSKQCCWIKKTMPDRNLINRMYRLF